ncbi:MAG TPA: hypothetical protein VGL83_01145 [Stellaceae bacterium]
MDFKKATDELFARITHEDLADALGVSVASIRQARLSTSALARREPPQQWERAAAKLAEQKAERLIRLASSLRK